MYRFLTIGVSWLLAGAFLREQSYAADAIVAGNYNGSNALDCAYYSVGSFFGTTFSQGARFRVNGSGNIELKRLILPLFNSSNVADASNYRLSIVRDEIWNPNNEVIWSGTPEGVGLVFSNNSFALNGIVQGGEYYWLLFEPVAEDSGHYAWALASSPLTYCGQEVPRDSGSIVSRYSTTGPPSGPWNIQVDADQRAIPGSLDQLGYTRFLPAACRALTSSYLTPAVSSTWKASRESPMEHEVLQDSRRGCSRKS